MLVGERVFLRKKRVMRIPVVMRTYAKVGGRVFGNTLTAAAIDEALKLLAGTSSVPLSQQNVSVRLLDQAGGSAVGPEWIRQSVGAPVPVSPLLPAPSAALRYTFQDVSSPSYTVGALELWVGSGASAYKFSDIDLEGANLTKAEAESWVFDVYFEVGSRSPNFLQAGVERMRGLISGSSSQHFSAANVKLRPYSDAQTPLPGNDLAATSATPDTSLNQLIWLFTAADGTFEGEWARIQLKIGSTVFRDGPCKTDGSSCGVKGADEEWGYQIALVLAGSDETSTRPRINSFTATPPSIGRGQTSTLAWDTNAGRSATLQEGSLAPVAVPLNGTLVVDPDETTTYRLVVTGPSGLTAEQSLTIAVAQGPQVKSFTATPGSIARGSSSVLAWTTENGQNATLQTGEGTPQPVALSGQTTVSPTTTTTYTLKVTAGTLSAQRVRTVYVGASAPPVIEKFEAVPDRVCKGSSAVFNWTVTGSYTSLEFNDGSGWVTVTGNSRTVRNIQQGGTYQLRANSANGNPVESEEITVYPTARVRYLNASDTIVCTGASTTLTWDHENAQAVEYKAGDGQWMPAPADKQLEVEPDETIRYYVRATDQCGESDTKSILITVLADPVITKFDAGPSPLPRGHTAGLQWAALHATSGQWRSRTRPSPDAAWGAWSDWTAAPIGVDGSVLGTSVGPVTLTTQYQFEAINVCHTARADDQITVCNLARIDGTKYTVSPAADQNGWLAAICSGAKATLNWAGAVASDYPTHTVRIVGTDGTNESFDHQTTSLDVEPTSDASYQIFVDDECGPESSGPTVRVRVFTAAPDAPGTIVQSPANDLNCPQAVTFSWPSVDSTGADGALALEYRFGGGAWQQLPPTATSVNLTVTASGTFELRAVNPCGTSAASSKAATCGGACTWTQIGARKNGTSDSYVLAPTIDEGDTLQFAYNSPNATKIRWAKVDPGSDPPGGSSPLWTERTNNNDTFTDGPVNEDKWYYFQAYCNSQWRAQEVIRPAVSGCPTIHSFSANPGIINRGATSRLRFNVTGQGPETWTIRINPDPLGNDDGTDLNTPEYRANGIEVEPRFTTTYRLSAWSAGGCQRDTGTSPSPDDVTVTVRATNCPEITDFSATPQHGEANRNVDLTWLTNGQPTDPLGPGSSQRGIAISNNVDSTIIYPTEDDLEDGVTVNPSVQTRYKLTLKKSGCTDAVDYVTVYVTTDPVITSFRAQRGELLIGQSTNLLFTYRNTTSLRLRSSTDNGATWSDWTTLTGTPTSHPTGALQQTTLYELEASKSGSTVKDTARYTVRVRQDAWIENFRADPSSIPYGGSTTLRWTAHGEGTAPRSTTINGVDVTGLSELAVGPLLKSTTYTIQPSNEHGPGQPFTITVAVGGAPPEDPLA